MLKQHNATSKNAKDKKATTASRSPGRDTKVPPEDAAEEEQAVEAEKGTAPKRRLSTKTNIGKDVQGIGQILTDEEVAIGQKEDGKQTTLTAQARNIAYCSGVIPMAHPNGMTKVAQKKCNIVLKMSRKMNRSLGRAGTKDSYGAQTARP